jgi:hypothetical protein
MLACVVISIMGCAADCARAATSPTSMTIEHLLNYIETSNCTFVRNGTVHDAKEAAMHIRKKYEAVKEKIRTAEQFVEYVAARSSKTGQPYRVQCGGEKPQASRDWLLKELSRYRKISSHRSALSRLAAQDSLHAFQTGNQKPAR